MLCVWLSGPSYHSLPRGRAIFSSFIYVGIMLYLCICVVFVQRECYLFLIHICGDHVVLCICVVFLQRGAIFSSFICVRIMLYLCICIVFVQRACYLFLIHICEDHVVFVYLCCICTEYLYSIWYAVEVWN